MSLCLKGALAAAIFACLAQTPAHAISSTTVTSPLTRGVAAPVTPIQRADGQYDAKGAAVMLATPNFTARVGTPEAMAREFLAARHAQLGLDASENATLVRTSERDGAHFSVVRFAQRIGGVPVYGSDVAVSVMPNGKIIYVSNATVPGATAVNASAAISSAQAIATATQYLGATALRRQKAERMIYVVNGASRLVWRVGLEADAGPRGDWELLVDAATGEVLRAEDKAAYENGNGTIWTPDPLSEDLATYGDPGYLDGNNADTPELTAALVPVVLENITNNAGTYTLEGPYAVCQDFDTPHDAGCPSQSSSDFSVTRSALTFDAVMGYYHITTYLKYVNETLGVPAMPLHHPGGIHFDPHGFSDADNSQYSSGGENLTLGRGGVDDAQDADVIIHELGHGIHDWVTGGHLSQAEGLSEGVGDYNAGSYSRDFPGQWTPGDAPYFWTFSWDGHNPFWPGRVTNYELNHTYAQARNQEIHTAGQYWASCNLLVRDVVGGAVMDKAYFEGLSMTGAGTNQQAAAQAVINAAAALGYSQSQIDAFGEAYNSGNAGGHAGCDYNVTVPDASGSPVVDVDTTPLAGSADEGNSTSTSFAIGNTGDATLAWNVDTSDNESCTTPSTTPWISFAPPSGSIASGAAETTVDVTLDAASLTAGEYHTFACVHSNDATTPVVAIPVTFTVTGNDTIFADGFDAGGGETCSPQQLFADPSFEATDPGTFTNPNWDATDSVSGTPFCDASCDDAGTLVAHTGDWFVWFGGYQQSNTASLSQSVVFPSGQPRWLNYWMINQVGGDPTASLTLSIDGTSVLSFPANSEDAFSPQTFEVPTTYLDGASHLVQFDWSADSTAGEIGGAMIDDVTLDCTAQPTRPAGDAVHGAATLRRVR
ncbi:MAG TPA: PepSY domain-containing protein [Rhodanobacteraceae bacterium]|nr:PepSY domain-containing protein [Rhodanobacteraceae bacterium]